MWFFPLSSMVTFPGFFLFLTVSFLVMSSNLRQNLSYSINLPKTTVHSEEVMSAVNKTLSKYYYEAHYEDYLNYYNLHNSLFRAEKYSCAMQTEKIILCEINACLWVKALNSAISNITKQKYPHYIVVHNIINYLLNTSSCENFGMVEEFFCRLLTSHPPKPEMWDYYWQIMSDHFVTLNDKKTEEEPLIFCLIEAITNCWKMTGNCDGSNQLNLVTTDSKSSFLKKAHSKSSDIEILKRVENGNIILNKSEVKVTKNQDYFIDLPSNERLKRCFIVFNFVYNILETDFIFWLKSKELKPCFTDRKPLISSLLWPNVRDIGLLNKEIHKILDLYELVKTSDLNFRITRLTEKLVTLLGEVIRCSDNIEEMKYPFVGIKSDNFFRELAVILHRLVEMKKNSKENELMVNFKPPWLRMFVCSRLLSLITGYQCLPELTEVYDILEHIAHSESRTQSSRTTLVKPDDTMNLALMKKLKRFKSINTKLKNGKTVLHVACEENDIEKIKALLTFPELDVNATDRSGWTPLHTASHKGSATSVQELLSFCPKSGGAQKPVNTRARGPESVTPLMCAVVQGHTGICQLLLEHSGSVLLEDVNDLNQTPLDLSNASEVTNILQYYKNNTVWTLHSQKDINFDLRLKEIVMRLCVEMIQAYFCTYRTWDVYRTLKRSEKNPANNLAASDVDLKWDYMRYHRDIKRNIYKLRRLIPKLEHIEEFKGLNDIYVRILSFNKTC